MAHTAASSPPPPAALGARSRARRALPRASAALALACLSLLAPVARGEPQPAPPGAAPTSPAPVPPPGSPRVAALSWVRLPGAETCIGALALGVAVERRLGRAALAAAGRADVSIEGRIEAAATSPRWRVTLSVADAAGNGLGSRLLSSDAADCRALDAEILLTTALLVDPDAATALPVSWPPVVPPPLPSPRPGPPPVTASPPVQPAPPLQPASPWRLTLLTGPVLSLGLLPSVGAGVVLRAIVSPPRFWPFQVGGVGWAPSAADLGGAGASLSLAAGSLALCPLHVASGPWRALACAGVEVGELRAEGYGFKLSSRSSGPVVQGTLEGRALRRLWGPLTASVGLGLLIPFVWNRFYALDARGEEREVYFTSPLAGQADVSLGVELP